MKEAVLDAPAAAEGQGDAVARERDLNALSAGSEAKDGMGACL